MFPICFLYVCVCVCLCCVCVCVCGAHAHTCVCMHVVCVQGEGGGFGCNPLQDTVESPAHQKQLLKLTFLQSRRIKNYISLFVAGTSWPPLKANTLRLYSMRFCPYAQRPRLVLAHKNIPSVTSHLKETLMGDLPYF